MAAPLESARYYRDLATLGTQVQRLMQRLWRRVDRADISRSWARTIPEAVGLLTGAQIVAAELADPYLRAVVGGTALGRIDPAGFAGLAADGADLASLLYLPAIGAKERITAGASPAGALRLERQTLALYARSETADAGRLSVAAAMGTRPHVTGYYRMLVGKSCPRCTILAGKWFRTSQGFRRHPNCDCVHIPVQEADTSYALDPRAAIAAGQVHGLSKADTAAILEHGADPSQVINAKRGTYLAGGRAFTTTGTSRRGVAGARMLARDLDRALGRPVTGRTYTDLIFSRHKATQYAELLRKGKTFTRTTRSGRAQSYHYQFSRSPRPTAEQILADATSREETVRLLTNFGYIL
ncbi:hypothetical protein [Actinoplanes sp. NPDC051851]|uniref:hypothetical protein n=1 Tax=Actinoplanes sp. NPDC051851 TaxID=3154753 RepID=UPI0034430C09